MTSHYPPLATQRRGSIPGLYPEALGSLFNTQRPTSIASEVHFSPPTDHPMDIDELRSPEATHKYSVLPRQPLYPTIGDSGSVWDHPQQRKADDRSAADGQSQTSPASLVTESARELTEHFSRLLTKGQHELLDQERGLLMAYANICEERYAEVKSNPSADLSPTSELATIKAEARTWLLFRTVVLRWLNAALEQPAAPLEDLPYFSAKVSAANAIMNDEDIVELKLVQTWLEESFQRTLTTAKLPLYNATRVTSDPVDPMSADDANAEAFYKVVFGLVQAGLVDEAAKYAERCQRSWVALALAGSKLHDVQGNDGWESVEAVTGNPMRNLHKAMCAAIESQSGVGRYERAVFSLLSGHLDGVLPVCETYESALHAIVTCTAEARISKFVGQDNANDYFHTETVQPQTSAPTSTDLSKLTLWDIFKSLNDGKLARKLDLHPAVTALHKTFFPGVHARLLADRSHGLVDLLEWFHQRHKLGALDLSQRRFATHLVMSVRQLHLIRKPTRSSLGNMVNVDLVMRDLVNGYIMALRQAGGLLSAIPVYALAVAEEHRPALMANALVTGPVEEWDEVFKKMDTMPGGFDLLEVASAVVAQVADELVKGGSAHAVKENPDGCTKLIHGVQLVVGYGLRMAENKSEDQLKRVVPVVTLAVRVLLSAEEWELADEVAGYVALPVVAPHARFTPQQWQFCELIDYQAFLRVIRSPCAFSSAADANAEASKRDATLPTPSIPTGLDLWLGDALTLLESDWLRFPSVAPSDSFTKSSSVESAEHDALMQSDALYRQFVPLLATRVAVNLAPVAGAFPGCVHRLLAALSRHRDAVYAVRGVGEEDLLVESVSKCFAVIKADALREAAKWGKAARSRFVVDARAGAGRERIKGLPRPEGHKG